MAKYLYDDFIVNLSNKFIRKLEEIEADYNFELGDEFEFAICEILQDLLPEKYGVTRGFVVSKDGRKEGDDIIIYDRNRFPTLRFREKTSVHRLENIPIEAVYAYVEAKHTINYKTEKYDSVFSKAFQQAVDVKKLISSREPSNIYSFNPYFTNPPFIKVPFSNNNLLPKINNPAFSCIVSRNFKFESNTLDNENIDINSIEFLTKNLLIPKSDVVPDLIVLNKDIILYPSIFEDNEVKEATLFNNHDKEKIAYRILIRPNIAYGIFLSHFLFAIDWIKLGKMPWSEIHFDATREK